MLHVVVWRWSPSPGADQDRVYTCDHVNRMASMLERHLRAPHRLHCFSDMEDGDPIGVRGDVQLHRLPETRGFKHCRRLKIFDPLVASLIAPEDSAPRIAQLDLDLVLVGDVTPLLAPAEPAPFMYSGSNISVMLLDPGQPAGLWDAYSADPEGTLRLAQRWVGNPHLSDQAVVNWWVRTQRVKWASLPPGLVKFPYRAGAVAWTPPPGARAVHMYGKKTNPASPEVQAANPWVAEHWR